MHVLIIDFIPIIMLLEAFSAKHTSLHTKSKDWSTRNLSERHVYPRTVDCCFSELALLQNITERVGLEQSGPHHNLIENYVMILRSWH